jgi:hypothetical protein
MLKDHLLYGLQAPILPCHLMYLLSIAAGYSLLPQMSSSDTVFFYADESGPLCQAILIFLCWECQEYLEILISLHPSLHF